MYTYIVALVLGVFFGFALNKAGLTRYTKIVNQFRLTDMAVLKFMMTALVVTMLGVYPLHEMGIITFPTIPATYVVGNLVGGADSGFESDQNEVTLVLRTGETIPLPRASKRAIADRILDEVLNLRLALHTAHGR